MSIEDGAVSGAAETFGLNVNLGPVSYTHLDVYKRQVCVCVCVCVCV